jgi:DNA-binding transcriptional LysR family regulator
LTQPAISQALAKIEAEFGITVFERSPRGVSLTDAGQVLVMRVDRALEELSKGITECIATLGTRRPDAMRLITTAQLIALVAVVEEGTFGAAARTAGRARATIHRAARELERVLGVTLYESTSHGLRATREAERLVHRVRLASTELLQARAELAALKGRDDGITTIGAMPLARSLLVPSAVLEFTKRRPGHSISILDGPYETMLESLRDGRADVLVGALRSRVPPDVRQELLFEDPLVIVTRAGHPLARDKHRLSWSSLARFDWIAPRPGSPLRARYDRVIARLARPRGAAIECNSLIAARAVLVASDRVMLSSEQQVHYELATGQLAVSPHPGGDIRRKIGLTTRRDWLPTEAQDELLAAIRSTTTRVRSATSKTK